VVDEKDIVRAVHEMDTFEKNKRFQGLVEDLFKHAMGQQYDLLYEHKQEQLVSESKKMEV
jgi:hypothetical protein